MPLRPTTSSSARRVRPAGSRIAHARSGGRTDWRAHSAGLQRALGRAESPRLRFCADSEPGIRRLRHGSGFRYVDCAGAPVRDAEMLLRIRSLAIPPAYGEVWICATGDGHLQATARDARGRKQYRYHPLWRAQRDKEKFGRLLAFGTALPAIRARVEQDLCDAGLSQRRVVAAVVHLLERTLLRIGNEEYARANGSYGLTTLRDDHVQVGRDSVRFQFRGKSGVEHDLHMPDPRLARIVRSCRDVPGQELFRYRDGSGRSRPIDSTEVNRYLRDIAGELISAKDFRTWTGSVLALAMLSQRPHRSRTQAKREVTAVIGQIARQLGNTPAVCRKAYVHPEVLSAWMEQGAHAFPQARARSGLSADEARLLRFLQQRQPATLRSAASQSRAKRSMPKRARA